MGMAENYKLLYEQMKKMVAMYQDEIVPGMRKTIEDLEKNQIKVRCKDCWKWYPYNGGGSHDCPFCGYPDEDDFCSYGEKRREGE